MTIETHHTMKKLFPIFVLSLLAIVACEPDPILFIDKELIEFDEEGGSQTVTVNANCAWEVHSSSGNFCTISPTTGEGEGYFTITAPENKTGEYRTQRIAVTCISNGSSVTAVVVVEQSCPAGDADIANWDELPEEAPAEGTILTFVIEANSDWTISANHSDVTFTATSGGAGQTEIEVIIPACPDVEGRLLMFDLSCYTESGGGTLTRFLPQKGGILTYAGESYRVVKMKDGKWWMAENLRYVPAGMTPSDDNTQVMAGIFYPIVYDQASGKAVFSTAEEDIRKHGYLYQSEVALGLSVGDITSVEQAQALEGTRGICPEGWHVPTKAEYVDLVGKSVGATTNPDAPYYNGSNGSLVMLNADGFNIDAYGMVSITDMTKTSGTLGGVLANFAKLSSGFYCGSSYATATYVTSGDPESGLKNLTFTGLMPMTNKAEEADYTCNGSNLAIRIGASLRCVKND